MSRRRVLMRHAENLGVELKRNFPRVEIVGPLVVGGIPTVKVKGDGDQVVAMGHFRQLKLFKYSTQFEYNGGKWGLEKCTIHWKKVQLHMRTMGFEGKYEKRMFDGAALVNSWQYKRARVVHEYIDQFKSDHRNNGASPMEEKFRSKAYDISLNDFVFNVSCEWLSNLEEEYFCSQHFNINGQDIWSLLEASGMPVLNHGAVYVSTEEQKTLDTISRMREDKIWHIPTNKGKQFATRVVHEYSISQQIRGSNLQSIQN